MSQRYVIDCRALYEQMVKDPGIWRAVQRWCRLNGMNPEDVVRDSVMVIEDSAYGLVIRYTAYLVNAEGHRYVDPDDMDRAATGSRTALLRFAPRPEWLSGQGRDLGGVHQ